MSLFRRKGVDTSKAFACGEDGHPHTRNPYRLWRGVESARCHYEWLRAWQLGRQARLARNRRAS